jgi:hypothetical protein
VSVAAVSVVSLKRSSIDKQPREPLPGSVEACTHTLDDGLQALEVIGQNFGELVGRRLMNGYPYSW